jgi:sugar-specific transcriptional regulator TrmB
MDTTILSDLGLSNAEIKVYLALLKIGETTAGPVITHSKLQNSVVHMTLKKLVEDGFATYVKKGNTKHYWATNPENVLTFIDEKKARFKQLLPELISSQNKTIPQQAEVFEGFKGFKVALQEMIADTKKGDEYLVFAFYTKNPNDFQNVYTYYVDFEKERKRKGLKVQVLAPSSIKNKFEKRDAKLVKFLDGPIPMNISVCNNKVLMTPWEDTKVTFLISSRQLADSFRMLFKATWNSTTSK